VLTVTLTILMIENIEHSEMVFIDKSNKQ